MNLTIGFSIRQVTTMCGPSVYWFEVLYTIAGTISDKSEAPEFLKVDVTSEGILLDWNSIIS